MHPVQARQSTEKGKEDEQKHNGKSQYVVQHPSKGHEEGTKLWSKSETFFQSQHDKDTHAPVYDSLRRNFGIGLRRLILLSH